ncbi:hypothetical protein [Rhodococcus sp. ACS1]|uniref:hypothetical protein n=1 Tax=Rhodococcus sp. ACS1 TaxID=2028570 RepID=UPI0015CEEA30|nr:hypothetical protein [Rhodococcus sp. ACS1]
MDRDKQISTILDALSDLSDRIVLSRFIHEHQRANALRAEYAELENELFKLIDEA